MKIRQLSSYLFCILAIFFFSTNELVGKLIDSQISPIAITAYRFFVGGVMLTLFALIKREHYRKFLTPHFSLLTSFIGVLNVCVSMFTLQLGVYYSGAGLSAIIISSNPIFVGVFASFILKERLFFKQIICMIVGLLGLALVIYHQFVQDTQMKSLPLGVLFSVIASVTFALYTVLSKRQIQRSNSLVFNSISFLAGSIVLFIFGLLFRQEMSLVADIKALSGLLYMGIFVTGIAYIFFFKGLQGIHTASGSSFFLLKPVFACIMAYLFLKETLSPLQIIGVVVVIVALFLQNIKKSAPPAPSRDAISAPTAPSGDAISAPPELAKGGRGGETL